MVRVTIEMNILREAYFPQEECRNLRDVKIISKRSHLSRKEIKSNWSTVANNKRLEVEQSECLFWTVGTLARSSGSRRRRSCCCRTTSTARSWCATRSRGATTIRCRCATATRSSITASASWTRVASSFRGAPRSARCRNWWSTTAETLMASALTSGKHVSRFVSSPTFF